MASLPVEILLGIYLGILTGIIPALVSWALGFVFKYFTGVTVPGFGVVVLGIALAGLNGGLLAIADPTVTQSANAPSVMTGLLVVAMMSLYAHNRGDAMGARVPKRLSLSKLRERTLSTEVKLPGRDEVRVRVVGDVADMEGYPPLSDDLRAAIRGTEWTFPSDLRISELESRLAERLKTEHDLGDVAVSLDEKGRASVVAAPPFSGLSKRIPGNKQAVSVNALVPTGVARGDEVTVITADAQVRGTVVSAHSRRATAGAGPDVEAPSQAGHPDETPSVPDDERTDGDESASPAPIRAPTTAGGEGRITVAVTRTDVQPLLAADRARVIVESRGTRREYELVSLLRRMGRRFKRLTVREDGPLDGATLGETRVLDNYDVTVLAVRHPDGWQVAPRGATQLTGGDELFAVGTREKLTTFSEAVA
ncbi:TrkA C-terminal domain-containing protein [Haloarculaceae archaeon H-GB1-1]|nr:TrkA C-terminal domain-containing protein [Haloarculaceae archaeon H-GB1-1]